MNTPLIACIIVLNLFPVTLVVADDEKPSAEVQINTGQSVIELDTEPKNYQALKH